MALARSSLNTSMALQRLPSSLSERVFSGHTITKPFNLGLLRHSLTGSVLAFSRRRNQSSAITSSSSSAKKPKSRMLYEDTREKEDEVDEDAFESLFNQLEKDLKNGDSSVGNDNGDDDDDDDMNEEDFDKFQSELEEALGIGDSDDDDAEMHFSAEDDVENDKGVEDDNDEEAEQRLVNIKNWQLRRLASALKTGRRKISIKSLAGDLCLDRAVVLKLLRDPPPKLVMMSAALPDKPAPTLLMPQSKPPEVVPAETRTADSAESKSEENVPVHILREKWFARKRLKKVQIDTLERVYRRTKRPTNAMISSIVHVTNLPRKKVVKWFEDQRIEDGIPLPQQRLPYRRSVAKAVAS